MQFFLDTANLDEIRAAMAQGLVDGVTTNPTLLARQGGDWRATAKAICKEVAGPVSLEVVGLTSAEMEAEARDLITFGPNVVIKLPMTKEGLKACKTLTAQDIQTNMTLVFSPMQGLLAAKAGATYVSPFVGRLDGLAQDGMELIEQLRTIFDNYDFPTKILVASIRNPMHVLNSALIGADVATIPHAVIDQLIQHPLTEKGLDAFLADWKTLEKK